LVIVLGSLVLGWSPNFDVLVAIPALVLATRAFASFGLVDGRQLRAEITLAVANAGFILLMLVSGMVIPVSKLPGAMRTVSEALPSEALSHVHAVGTGAATGTRAWVVLAVWAVVGPVLAAKFFRWE
jgi:ABC-2 type transport system permease protein